MAEVELADRENRRKRSRRNKWKIMGEKEKRFVMLSETESCVLTWIYLTPSDENLFPKYEIKSHKDCLYYLKDSFNTAKQFSFV